MFRNYIFILSFLFCFNTVAQTIESIQIDEDQKISDLLIKFEISPTDFFILNPEYSANRFDYNSIDLNKKLFKGDLVRVFNSKARDQSKIGFITHKIKRKQNLDQISVIYNISSDDILEYNKNVIIKKNNIIRIPIKTDRKLNVSNKLSRYVVNPKEGKWRIAYKYGISIDFLEELNPEIGSFLRIGQEIAVPNKKKIELNSIDENKQYFEVQKNIETSTLEKNLGLKNNSINRLNPEILENKLTKGIIIKVPSSADLTNEVINLSKASLENNIVDFNKRKFALILPFRLNNYDYDSIQNYISLVKNDKLLNISLDFLFGVEMAVTEFSKLGLNVKMDIFDSALDKNQIDKIINENDINQYDFILGPFTNNLFDYTVSSVNDYDVKIVRPLAKKLNINKNIINTIPDDSIYFNTIIDFVKNDTINSPKFIIADSKSIGNANKIKKVFPNAQQFFSKIDDFGNDTKTLDYQELDSIFVKGKNIVFLETKEQGFVSNVTSILNSFVNDTISIELVTTNKNNAFEGVNISNNFLSNLKFTYASTNKVIKSKVDKLFIDNFISRYKNYPNKYSIRAYDLTYDLLMRFSNGDINDLKVHSIETEYFENKFRYKLSNSGSIDNTGVYLMMYNGLEIEEIIEN
tara:strand:+ start:184 stop:2091 length:1908 start_codon:yes stop_codon:yes gene_type:complete